MSRKLSSAQDIHELVHMLIRCEITRESTKLSVLTTDHCSLEGFVYSFSWWRLMNIPLVTRITYHARLCVILFQEKEFNSCEFMNTMSIAFLLLLSLLARVQAKFQSGGIRLGGNKTSDSKWRYVSKFRYHIGELEDGEISRAHY